MAFKVSTGLRNYMLATGSFKAALDGGKLKLYSGTVPATADDSLGAAVELVEITESGDGVTGLTFEAAAVSGVLAKTAAETWQGAASQSGTATFFRFVLDADLTTTNTTDLRIQGTVDTIAAELNLSDTSIVAPGVQTINHFNVALPTL